MLIHILFVTIRNGFVQSLNNTFNIASIWIVDLKLRHCRPFYLTKVKIFRVHVRF